MHLEFSVLVQFLSIIIVVVTLRRGMQRNQGKVPCSGTLVKQRTRAYRHIKYQNKSTLIRGLRSQGSGKGKGHLPPPPRGVDDI